MKDYCAECELSCLTSQCLTGRRIGVIEKLQAEIKVWFGRTNLYQSGVDWQFQVEDAHTDLKRIDIKIKTG